MSGSTTRPATTASARTPRSGASPACSPPICSPTSSSESSARISRRFSDTERKGKVKMQKMKTGVLLPSSLLPFVFLLLPSVERPLPERVAEEACVPPLSVGRPGGAQGVRASRVGREVQTVGLARARDIDNVAAARRVVAIARDDARAEDFVVAVAVEVCRLLSPLRAAEALNVEGQARGQSVAAARAAPLDDEQFARAVRGVLADGGDCLPGGSLDGARVRNLAARERGGDAQRGVARERHTHSRARTRHERRRERGGVARGIFESARARRFLPRARRPPDQHRADYREDGEERR